MTIIRSGNEAYCALEKEQETEHTVICIPPNPSPEVSKKKDDSPKYVEINAYKHIVMNILHSYS